MSTKTKFQIKSIFGALLFEHECETLKEAVVAANLGGADLRGAYLGDAYLRDAYLGGANLGGAYLGGANLGGANLGDANLRDAYLGGANLRGADLRGADLGDADLGGANLRGADLRGANLRGADLRGANLRDAYLRDAYLGGAYLGGANLRGADLRGADLGDADLGGANLRGADLRGANLRGANLNYFKQDLIAEVLRLPNELDALREAIVAGKIDGTTYSGECACLAGTLAKAKGIDGFSGWDIGAGKTTYHVSASSPREQWFMGIGPGDMPETNQMSALALEWLDEAIAIRDGIRASIAA